MELGFKRGREVVLGYKGGGRWYLVLKGEELVLGFKGGVRWCLVLKGGGVGTWL